MSVFMTLRIKADGQRLEAWADANRDTMASIIEKGERHGLMAHRFYSDGHGELLVLDEWPDAESFQTFFNETQNEIGPLMAAAGAQGEPEISFWHELNTPDKYGWGARSGMAHTA